IVAKLFEFGRIFDEFLGAAAAAVVERADTEPEERALLGQAQAVLVVAQRAETLIPAVFRLYTPGGGTAAAARARAAIRDLTGVDQLEFDLAKHTVWHIADGLPTENDLDD